jgi:isopenicillin-N N-acyltransferase like protein
MYRKFLKVLLWFLFVFIVIFIIVITALFLEVRPRIPKLSVDSIGHVEVPKVLFTTDSLAYIKNNKFRKNRYGLYELYVEGDGFTRGLNAGALTSELVKYQEEVFVKKITEIIPSERYRGFLQTLIIWFNSKMYTHIKPEFIEEIYGISLSASSKFDFYGPAFYRLLNYHAAHDVGHTLQTYNLVGCTSFAVWNQNSSDSSLVVGRNFDFYFGEDFAANKIIEFVNPTKGIKFAFVTWGGMTGAVSGMNQAGLSITINSGTPSIAKRTGTPVSLLAREILQFASTIDEAVKIANSRKTFVAESYLVASAIDKRAVIIEKTPYAQDVVEASNSSLLCTNHYQGKILGNSKENDATKKRATGYRYKRLQELVGNNIPLDFTKTASILRDQKGLAGEDLGMGNEMAMNQLIAHHSVIFSPEKKIMWVSTSPNVLGSYVAYDLNTIFDEMMELNQNKSVDIPELEVPADSFLYTMDFKKYSEFKEMKEDYVFFNFMGNPVPDSIYSKMILLNPNSFEPYLWRANQAISDENYSLAVENIETALTKVIPEATKESLEIKLKKFKARRN